MTATSVWLGLHRLTTAIQLLAISLIFTGSLLRAAEPHSEEDSAELARVKVSIQQGKLGEAESAIQKQLQQNPSVDGYNLLGIVESDKHDYVSAVAALRHALQIAHDQKDTGATHNLLGNVYVAQASFDLAEQEFLTALRLAPANSDANYNLGSLLLSRGSPGKAIPYLERVHPRNAATAFNLIRAYFEMQRTPEAMRLATDLSNQHREDVQAHFSLGVLLASEKQYKAATLELEKAEALQPSTFEILYNLGQTLLRSGAYPDAQLVLNRALKLKPESPETLYLLAEVLAAESRPMDALGLLVHAHDIAPDNMDAVLLMARISIAQRYYEDAIPLLESGLAVAPKRSDLRAALGESYLMSDRVDKAIDQFNQIVAVAPSARLYILLGLSYQRLGRFDEAKQHFQQALKLDPHNSECLFHLGFIAERQGNAVDAEAKFQQILRANPSFADALFETANLRIAAKQFAQAADLLRKYVQVSQNPATGYYKLAMVERSLHQTAAADRDLGQFQALSKSAPGGQYPNEHLFDYLDNRSRLAPRARAELDIAAINEQLKSHPDQPQGLYLLAEAYLKSGQTDEATKTIARLDSLSAGDYRTLTGVGVLLARYRLYDGAIQHFQAALQANPDRDNVADSVRFDLANAYFRKGDYRSALDALGQISQPDRKDDAYLALLGDVYAHLGDTARATEIYRDALLRNPDNDQDYLALALLKLRQNDTAAAKEALNEGRKRIPGSGKIIWGLGVASALEGNTAEAEQHFERAVEMLPEWPGSYSTLGVFYFQTGQIDKAKEVLDRFRNSQGAGSLDIHRIEKVLAQTPASASPSGNQPMTMTSRQQLLQLALSLADRTL